MDIIANPYRGQPDAFSWLDGIPFPGSDARRPAALIAKCPDYRKTPLVDAPALAARADVAAVFLKDERARMGLGSFKALGAAYVIAEDAARDDARGATYVTASAGNHGLSVAAGARVFGARAAVYIAETVPESFAERLRGQGAEVVREGATYEDSMAAAAAAAQARGWRLLSDSSWPGYTDRPHRLMQGYLVMMHEIAGQIAEPPTHLFLQAGVGGMAGAVAAMARDLWRDTPGIVIVEPAAAPALAASIAAGNPVHVDGPVSAMGRLDCKEPSLIALRGLARDADAFATITEAEGLEGAAVAAAAGFASTASGAAGLAGLLAAGSQAGALGLSPAARVLLILSEGPDG